MGLEANGGRLSAATGEMVRHSPGHLHLRLTCATLTPSFLAEPTVDSGQLAWSSSAMGFTYAELAPELYADLRRSRFEP